MKNLAKVSLKRYKVPSKEFLMGPFYFASVKEFESAVSEIFSKGLVCKVKITSIFCPTIKLK